MIGINESHLAATAFDNPDKVRTLWKRAYHKARELSVDANGAKPFERVHSGNLDVGSLRAWIDSVEVPQSSDSKAMAAAKKANVDLLARYVASTQDKLTDEEKIG